MKAHAKDVWVNVWKYRNERFAMFPVKNADHLKVCSCSMCCNPRRQWKGDVTRQEKLAALRMKDEY